MLISCVLLLPLLLLPLLLLPLPLLLLLPLPLLLLLPLPLTFIDNDWHDQDIPRRSDDREQTVSCL